MKDKNREGLRNARRGGERIGRGVRKKRMGWRKADSFSPVTAVPGQSQGHSQATVMEDVPAVSGIWRHSPREYAPRQQPPTLYGPVRPGTVSSLIRKFSTSSPRSSGPASPSISRHFNVCSSFSHHSQMVGSRFNIASHPHHHSSLLTPHRGAN